MPRSKGLFLTLAEMEKQWMRLGILSGDSMELVDGVEMEGLRKTVQDDSSTFFFFFLAEQHWMEGGTNLLRWER